ncbi:hypothetical protein [Salinispira pacifica]
MKRSLALSLLLLVGLSAYGYALDVEEALSLLKDKALAVHITARVTENGKQTIWNMDLSEVTISGRAVTVKLNGSNMVVVATFTPYRETSNSVLLVAQGQTWITSPVDKQVRYATSFRSLPIDMGEKVLFYPLGVNVQTEKYGNINIELEIRVVPYSKSSQPSTASPSKGQAPAGSSNGDKADSSTGDKGTTGQNKE